MKTPKDKLIEQQKLLIKKYEMIIERQERLIETLEKLNMIADVRRFSGVDLIGAQNE